MSLSKYNNKKILNLLWALALVGPIKILQAIVLTVLQGYTNAKVTGYKEDIYRTVLPVMLAGNIAISHHIDLIKLGLCVDRW